MSRFKFERKTLTDKLELVRVVLLRTSCIYLTVVQPLKYNLYQQLETYIGERHGSKYLSPKMLEISKIYETFSNIFSCIIFNILVIVVFNSEHLKLFSTQVMSSSSKKLQANIRDFKPLNYFSRFPASALTVIYYKSYKFKKFKDMALKL